MFGRKKNGIKISLKREKFSKRDEYKVREIESECMCDK